MTTPDGVKHWDKLITVSIAPGYRDISLQLSIRNPVGTKGMEVNLKKEDAEVLLRELYAAFDVAWNNSSELKPIDFEPGERRPTCYGKFIL